MSKVPKFCFEDSPPAKPAKVAKLYSGETPQASPSACPVTCESCPWYELNPWTHYPDFGAWCHHQMEHLVVGSPACEEFQHGEVPARQNHDQVPQVQTSAFPAPQAPPREKIVRCGPRQLSLEAEGWIYQEGLETDDPSF